MKINLSAIGLTVRYKFNTARSKYKGTGAGKRQSLTQKVVISFSNLLENNRNSSKEFVMVFYIAKVTDFHYTFAA